MASRLEAATKQYGVTVLLSDAFVAMLSPPVAARIRQVDCVTVKGSQQPVGLYTYDTSTDGLDVWVDMAKKATKVGEGLWGRVACLIPLAAGCAAEGALAPGPHWVAGLPG